MAKTRIQKIANIILARLERMLVFFFPFHSFPPDAYFFLIYIFAGFDPGDFPGDFRTAVLNRSVLKHQR